MPDINKKLEDVLKKRDRFINETLSAYDLRFSKATKKLMDAIIKEYIDKFDYKGNTIVFSSKNLRNIEKLDKIFDDFAKTYSDNIFREFGSKMLDMAVYSKEYYARAGNAERLLNKIGEKIDLIGNRLGIDAKGNLIPNSYLDRLSKSPTIREQLKDYVAKNISNNSSLSTFQKGFSEIIEGTADVESDMMKYWKTETHDAIFEVGRAEDDLYASELGLNFFIYLPGEISTSRPFCKGGSDKKCGCTFDSKIGKMFHRQEIIDMYNTMDWQGKKEGNPIQVLGGWNCRHYAGWISDAEAERRDPEKFAQYAETTGGEQ